MKNRRIAEKLNMAGILIVDDEQSIRDILYRTLNVYGYECAVASDGISALIKIRTQQPDLVLLDISMPGKSGMDVLKEIKSKYEDTAVIMVTAVAELDTAINAMKSFPPFNPSFRPSRSMA